MFVNANRVQIEEEANASISFFAADQMANEARFESKQKYTLHEKTKVNTSDPQVWKWGNGTAICFLIIGV